MSVWLARNKDQDSVYKTFQGKPYPCISGFNGNEIDFHSSNGVNGYRLGTYCPDVMHRLSNMRLKPGTMVRLKAVKFTV